MRFKMLLLFVAVMLAGCSETPQFMGAAVDNDQNVLTGGPITGTTLQDLPVSVREALKTRAPRAEIVSITKSRRNGSVVYNISFANSDTPEIYLRDDGRVMPEPLNAKK